MEIQNNELRIQIPQNMEIDKEHSTFECIKFKPIKQEKWRNDTDAQIKGYYISYGGYISDQPQGKNIKENWGLFATEKQAKSALAMARISQIMANDERFGGVVTDEEWRNSSLRKYAIIREGENIYLPFCYTYYSFLTFHTEGQRDLFLEENEDLVKDYLMLD